MFTLISLLLVGVALGRTPQSVQPFPDVPKNHWAYAAVTELHEKGILQGYPGAYDRSTPYAALHSLVKAIRNGDEAMIRELTAPRWQKIWLNSSAADKKASHEQIAMIQQTISYKSWPARAARYSREEWEQFNAKVRQVTFGTEVEFGSQHPLGSHSFLFYFVRDPGGWKIASVSSTEGGG